MLYSALSIGSFSYRRLYVRSILLLGCFVLAFLCGASATPWVVDRIPSMLEVGLVLVSSVGFIVVLNWCIPRYSMEFHLGGFIPVLILTLRL